MLNTADGKKTEKNERSVTKWTDCLMTQARD